MDLVLDEITKKNEHYCVHFRIWAVVYMPKKMKNIWVLAFLHPFTGFLWYIGHSLNTNKNKNFKTQLIKASTFFYEFYSKFQNIVLILCKLKSKH